MHCRHRSIEFLIQRFGAFGYLLQALAISGMLFVSNLGFVANVVFRHLLNCVMGWLLMLHLSQKEDLSRRFRDSKSGESRIMFKKSVTIASSIDLILGGCLSYACR